MGQLEKHQHGTKREQVTSSIKNGEWRMGYGGIIGKQDHKSTKILGFASMLEVTTHHHQKHRNELILQRSFVVFCFF